MTRTAEIVFGPFRLDVADERLWRDGEPVALSPKAFALLRYLAERPGRLQAKQDLLDALWPGTLVTDASLHGCVREIRRALGDESRVPRFVETVHRRGYRFIARADSPPEDDRGPRAGVPAPSRLIGRETELDQLGAAFARASGGARQAVFVTGEPGIGKTALVDAFLDGIASRGGTRVARGQCFEHYGPGEAYLPVLEAIGLLSGGPAGRPVREVLARFAPTWLARMPALAPKAVRAGADPGPGVTNERMLREMAEALEALAADTPLVVALEDVHWVDYSTLDLICALAQRRGPARLMLLLTYRPADALALRHPLHGVKQDLHAHRQCRELSPGLLGAASVAEYLAGRFPGIGVAAELAAMVHRRTDGNPLFLVNVVDELVAQEVLVERSGHWEVSGRLGEAGLEMPEGIRELVERQADRLEADERRTLEAAAVAGVEFTAGAVAAALDVDPAAIEGRCEGLAHRHLFLLRCTVPDEGTARYRFIHGLYQEVLYGQVPPSRRASWHMRVGAWGEATDSGRSGEAAAELAMHFERGRDHGRAVLHLERAAERAARLLAHREAIGQLRTALDLLRKMPGAEGNPGRELRLQMALGLQLQISQGYASPGAAQAYSRARELCGRMPETPGLAPVLWGLWMFAAVRADNRTALEVAEQLHRLGRRVRDPVVHLHAQAALGVTRLFLGDPAASHRHLDRAVALYDPREHGGLAGLYAQDPRVTCLAQQANALWLLGYPDRAARASREAVSLAETLGHPHSLALALFFSAVLHQRLRDPEATRLRADALAGLAAEHGFALWSAGAAILQGWAVTQRGDLAAGIEAMRGGLADWRATGAAVNQTYYLVLIAEALGEARRIGEGLSTLAEAVDLMRQTGERYYEAELHRLRGELFRMQASHDGTTRSRGRRPEPPPRDRPSALSASEAGYHEAIAAAARQGAKALELKAAMGLIRLDRQRVGAGSPEGLRKIYERFDEGFGTRDLDEAKALLGAMAVG